MEENNRDILIHPVKGKNEKKLPRRSVIMPNPADAHEFARRFAADGRMERRFLYNSDLFVDPGQDICIAGPCLGAPAAVLVMEKLIALGVREIVVLSCCGSVSEKLVVGDIVIATAAVSGEGVSHYYQGGRTAAPSIAETERLRNRLHRHGTHWHEVCIWTTDAPYRESREMLKNLQEHDGVGAVDMEFSALCTVASLRQVACAGLFVVSDELWGDTWKPDSRLIVFARVKNRYCPASLLIN